MNPRHFISLHDLTSAEFRTLIARAIELKNNRNPDFQPLKGKVLAMIFEKSSTRTRISFEAGMIQLGAISVTAGHSTGTRRTAGRQRQSHF